jgi:hypothetical protein
MTPVMGRVNLLHSLLPYFAKSLPVQFNIGTYLLTPWSRVLLEKLTSLQLVKKFLAFYGT